MSAQPVLPIFHREPEPVTKPWVDKPFARARTTDPETSHEAAKPDRAVDRHLVYRALIAAGPDGLTDFELAARLNVSCPRSTEWQQTSAGKRRGELRDQGLVCDSGRKRKSPSGSRAIVWRVTTPEERQQ